MRLPARLRLELIELPIVEVDFAIRVLNDPKIAKTLVGVRRQIVNMALQALERAKQDQVNGQCKLDKHHVGVVLQAIGQTQAWWTSLKNIHLDDEEQL